jgi:uncharacterized protein (DUF305 family)
MRKFPALAALTLSLSLALTGCGSDDSNGETSPEVSTTEHNDADVAFASDMIQHHSQALAMVDLTVGRDLDPAVQSLTEDIRQAQGPEIETMTDWLTEWGEPVPSTARDHANAEDHGGHETSGEGEGSAEMPGMMSEEDMADLEEASDSEFQDMWLEMMIEHHEGAIEMAQNQQAEGQYKAAVDLAEDIETSQQAEVESMQGLLF